MAAALVLTLSRLTIPVRLALAFELARGLLLVFLGVQMLLRLRRARLHAHIHTHRGHQHSHIHSHAGSTLHPELHHRGARARLPLRRKSFAIGLVHGLTGSAAVMLLVLAGIESPALRMVYVTIFGLGSVAGMAAVTVVLTLPLVLSARRAPALGPPRAGSGIPGRRRRR